VSIDATKPCALAMSALWAMMIEKYNLLPKRLSWD
jgi:hypothetical protein